MDRHFRSGSCRSAVEYALVRIGVRDHRAIVNFDRDVEILVALSHCVAQIIEPVQTIPVRVGPALSAPENRLTPACSTAGPIPRQPGHRRCRRDVLHGVGHFDLAVVEGHLFLGKRFSALGRTSRTVCADDAVAEFVFHVLYLVAAGPAEF